MPHWTDSYYGALYLDTVEDLLTPRLSALEAERIAALLALAPGDRVLDLACGHGRHAGPMAARARTVVGLDRSAAYLARAARAATAGPRAPRLVRADVRALPFRDAAFDAVYSWYASLFMFDDATNAACLAEAARAVRRGGRVLVHHANPLRLALDPSDASRRTLADGSRVEEACEFDAATGVDRATRVLTRASGAVLSGTAELRYYRPSEWAPLAERAGLRILELTSTTGAGPPGPEAPDLVALLERAR